MKYTEFKKHQVFGNVPHQSSILYLNFLRDERTHPVRQMFALDKVPNAKPKKTKRKRFDHAAINNFLPKLLPGFHKLQSIVCII